MGFQTRLNNKQKAHVKATKGSGILVGGNVKDVAGIAGSVAVSFGLLTAAMTDPIKSAGEKLVGKIKTKIAGSGDVKATKRIGEKGITISGKKSKKKKRKGLKISN